MLTFAGRPKSSVFGSHRTDTSLPMEGEGGGGVERGGKGGTSSRFKRLSFMMHSSRPAQTPDSDRSPVSSIRSKLVQSDTKMATNAVTTMVAGEDTTRPVQAKTSNTLQTSVSYIPPDAAVGEVVAKLDAKQSSSEEPSPTDAKKASITFPDDLPKPDHSPSERTPTDAFSESSFGRKSSVSSVSFRRSRNPSVAPCLPKQTAHGVRIRNASPPPQR
ncbi:hypothetical protein ED733_000677 [Metarhizium rileyi]|uniref:Uncharacterized protein n=1 Tax=Metarhizium rileyi (strain RCEF 4871) TaxID=1649241 RepID=A0A5C6G042_METRR|nr:hypothetical protein ED733_000677 [Metarhizium rileyi]